MDLIRSISSQESECAFSCPASDIARCDTSNTSFRTTCARDRGSGI